MNCMASFYTDATLRGIIALCLDDQDLLTPIIILQLYRRQLHSISCCVGGGIQKNGSHSHIFLDLLFDPDFNKCAIHLQHEIRQLVYYLVSFDNDAV
ncbi:hypothetical protein CEXT_703831 [Caerostris extrusa]|uniref:Uncharacterized protein n=1 Tax=Caerostris extrusa TaxID=172846 RepID=A0AAV4P7F5_CAEEX|nr:hypothetical protein CEXT_703831 [Caerostris extrusa]